MCLQLHWAVLIPILSRIHPSWSPPTPTLVEDFVKREKFPLLTKCARILCLSHIYLVLLDIQYDLMIIGMFNWRSVHKTYLVE